MGIRFLSPRCAVRFLRRNPVVAVVATLAVALGVGVNTAIFSMVRGLLLRSLPYPRADEIVRIWHDHPVSAESFVVFEETARSFAVISAFGDQRLVLVGDDRPEELAAGEVSPSHFEVLGVQPFLGRAFTPAEREPGHGDVVILSHGLWRRRFGGQDDIIGKTISLGERERTVVGVMPASYRPLRAAWQVWVPLTIDPSSERHSRWVGYRLMGRLAPGASLEAAQADTQRVVGLLHEMNPARISEDQARRATVVPLAKVILGEVGRSLLLLQGMAALVLAICCFNVANLLLAGVDNRQRELAVRSSLGASRGRLAGQLLSESLGLGLLGGMSGALFAGWAVAGLRGTLLPWIPRAEEIRVDLGVFGFALVMSLLSVVAFGVAPALRASGVHLQAALKAGGGTPGSGRHRLRHGLVALQIAMTVVLVIAVGLLAQSFWKLRHEPLGFTTAKVRTFKLAPPNHRYADDTSRGVYFQEVIDSLAGVSGVASVGAVNVLPVGGGGDLRSPYLMAGQEMSPGERPPLVSFRVVTPEFLDTLAVGLLKGRALTPADRAGRPSVGLVNQAMARVVWKGEDPLGQELLYPDGRLWFTIVGVVADLRFADPAKAPEPQVYLPLAQQAWPTAMFFAVRAESSALSFSVLESAVWSVDDEVPITEVATMDEVVGRALRTETALLWLVSAFAVLALVLASVGVYGMTACTVSQHIHDTGVRVALGATGEAILRNMVGRVMRPVAYGLLLGVVAAYGLTRFLESFLYEVQPIELPVFVLVPFLLAACAALAGYLPARRVTRIDPLSILGAD